MQDDTYRRLAQHLDRLPGGFPPSDTNADIQVLRRLFTPEEASLAVHLTLEQEEAETIAGRAGLPIDEARQRLAEMAQKGLLFSVRPAVGAARYQAVPWVVGIYEFQVNRLNEGFLQDLAEYRRTRTRPSAGVKLQMRTIPVGKSLDAHLEVLPYERVDDLIKTRDRIAVTSCICRREARMRGEACEAPEETCLMFDRFADYYVQTGRGRAIDRSELAKILTRAEAANLVLQPSNSSDIAFLCCCCGCCCGVLKGFKARPRPAEVATSSFMASLEAEVCNGCEVCLARCQMGALAASKGDEYVRLDIERCIGCGLCVSVCPTGALTLVRKPETQRTIPPMTMEAAWRTIVERQAPAH